MSSPARRLLPVLFLSALFFALASGVFVHRSQPKTTTYSDLIRTVEHQSSSITAVLFMPRSQTIHATLADGIPANGAGPMLQVTFDGCQGHGLPVATDYKCTILDASDESGNSIDFGMFGCAVTVP